MKNNIKRCKNCGHFYYATQMILSKKELKPILIKLNNKINKNEFSIGHSNANFQLKNLKNMCFFFDPKSKGCRNYERGILRFLKIFQMISPYLCVLCILDYIFLLNGQYLLNHRLNLLNHHQKTDSS